MNALEELETKELLSLLDKLSERQRIVMEYRMDGMTLAAIAKILPNEGTFGTKGYKKGKIGISPERVRQMEIKAIRILRSHYSRLYE